MAHPLDHSETQRYAERLSVEYFLAYHNGTSYKDTIDDIGCIDPEIRPYVCGIIQQMLRTLRPVVADHFIQNVVNLCITEGPKYNTDGMPVIGTVPVNLSKDDIAKGRTAPESLLGNDQ